LPGSTSEHSKMTRLMRQGTHPGVIFMDARTLHFFKYLPVVSCIHLAYVRVFAGTEIIPVEKGNVMN